MKKMFRMNKVAKLEEYAKNLTPLIKQYDEDIKNLKKVAPNTVTEMTGYVKALRSVQSGLCEILDIEIDEE